MNKHNKKSDRKERERDLKEEEERERVMLKLTLQETYFTLGTKKQTKKAPKAFLSIEE